MQATDITDVNTTESASSNDSSSTGAVVENQDVNTETSTPSVEQTANPDKAEKSLEDVVKDAFDKSTSPAEEEKQDKEKPPVEDKELTQEGEEKVEKVEEKGPIPYERFQEVNSQKVELESKWKEAEPLVEAHKSVVDFCQKNDIAPEEFQFWLDIAAKAKNDPNAALEALAPQLKQLQAFKGEELDPELKAAVDSGEITLPMAKRLAAAEAQKKWGEAQTKKQQERQEAQLAHRYQEEMKSSLVSWAESKGKSIPDFKPKSAGQDDGIFELFIHKYMADAPHAKLTDQKSLTSFAEKTLESVLKSVKRFSPVSTATNKVLRTSQTNNGASKTPNSVDEVIAATARKHGIVT